MRPAPWSAGLRSSATHLAERDPALKRLKLTLVLRGLTGGVGGLQAASA
jgi:hypothetical protein